MINSRILLRKLKHLQANCTSAKKLNQMKYINKLGGELIDIADKKLAPLINDSFSYTRDFFAYSKQENNIFTFDNSKFVDPKEKEGLMIQHSNGQLVITGKYCPEGVQNSIHPRTI